MVSKRRKRVQGLLRAIYKPDAETKDGILLFKQKKIRNVIYLVMVSDPEISYEYNVIKQDKDWFFWRKS